MFPRRSRSFAPPLLVLVLASLSAAQEAAPPVPPDDGCIAPPATGAGGGASHAFPPPPIAPVRIGDDAPDGLTLWPGLQYGWTATSCPAGNARDNVTTPYEVDIDYVPVTEDDSLGYHVVYSAKANGSGTGVALNVTMSLIPLNDGSLLLFGGGYGDSIGPGTALNSAAYDAANVASAVRNCMGRTPQSTPIHFVSPHWHGDHINEKIIAALEAQGFPVPDIFIHQDDLVTVAQSYAWSQSELDRFVVIPDGPCNTPIAVASSPLGPIWATARKGHAPGAIDLVIDVRGNPNDRFMILGSVAGGACPTPPDGTRQSIDAHKNVILDDSAQSVPYGCSSNPAGSLTTNDVPSPGAVVTVAADDPTATVQPPGLVFLYFSYAPAPGYPCGVPIGLGKGMPHYDLLLDTTDSLFRAQPPLLGLWLGPGRPASFPIRIPRDSSVLDLSAYLQAMIVNPFASSLSRVFVLTEGLELRGGS